MTMVLSTFLFSKTLKTKQSAKISPKFSFLNDRHTFSFPPMTFWDFFLKAAFSRTQWVLLQKLPSELFLGKGVLKICSKFTGEHPCHSAILIMQLYWNRTSAWVLSCKFAAYIFTAPFPKNTSGGLLLLLHSNKYVHIFVTCFLICLSLVCGYSSNLYIYWCPIIVWIRFLFVCSVFIAWQVYTSWANIFNKDMFWEFLLTTSGIMMVLGHRVRFLVHDV